MKERATIAGGHLETKTGRNGTAIKLTLPKETDE